MIRKISALPQPCRWITQEIVGADDGSVLANEISRVRDFRNGTQSIQPPNLAKPVNEEAVRWALKAAMTMEDINRKAATLIALTPCLPEPLLRDALEIAINIWDEDAMVRVLVALVPRLPESFLRAVLQRTQYIQDQHLRASVMSAAAPFLPESGLAEVLAHMGTIRTVVDVTYALDGVAPYLPMSLLRHAFSLAKTIRDDKQQAWTLVTLARYLSEPFLDQALEIATSLDDDSDRARALISLASQLPDRLNQKIRAEALEVALAIADKQSRAKILASFSADLAESAWQTALQAARESEDEESWSKLLAAIAPHLPESELLEQLEAVRNKKPKTVDDLGRAMLLALLAVHLSEPIKEQTIRAAILASMASDPLDHRVSNLVGVYSVLGPLLSESLFKEALGKARSLGSAYARGSVLAVLAHHAPDDVKQEVVDEAWRTAAALQSEMHQTNIIVVLFPDLPDFQRTEVLGGFHTLKPGEHRTDLLKVISPYLSESGFREVLSTVRETGDSSRARDLAAVAPHLPETLLFDALTIALEIEWDAWLLEALEGLADVRPC